MNFIVSIVRKTAYKFTMCTHYKTRTLLRFYDYIVITKKKPIKYR